MWQSNRFRALGWQSEGEVLTLIRPQAGHLNHTNRERISEVRYDFPESNTTGVGILILCETLACKGTYYTTTRYYNCSTTRKMDAMETMQECLKIFPEINRTYH